MDKPADTPRTTDVYQLHIGATPDQGALKDSSQGSHPAESHGKGEAAFKPVSQHVKVYKGKVTTQKVSEVVNYATPLGPDRRRPCGCPEQLVQLSRLFARGSPGCTRVPPPLWPALLHSVCTSTSRIKDARQGRLGASGGTAREIRGPR